MLISVFFVACAAFLSIVFLPSHLSSSIQLREARQHFFEEAESGRSAVRRITASYESCQAEKRVKTYQVSRGNAAREKEERQKMPQGPI